MQAASTTGSICEMAPAEFSTDSVIELSERVHFNMHDAYYEHATAEHFWIQWRFNSIRKLLQGLSLGKNVFEVGCGNGVVQQQFETAFDIAIDGCDLNYDAMAKGLPTRGQKFLYNVFDQLGEWQGSFDSVLLLDTIEHIETPTEFLTAIGNHLVDDGLLVVNVPAMPFLYSRYDSVQGHVRRYRLQQLELELQSAGFELLKHKYWGGNVIPIAYLRKLLASADDDKVLTQGFQPPGKFAEGILRTLMNCEQAGLKLLPYGTSLSAVARKQKMGQR